MAETETGLMVKAVDLRKTYGDFVALDGVSLSVRRGEVLAIVGGSGSGKSTLLRCLNYLDPPDAGEVYIDGRLMGSVVGSNAPMRSNERELRRRRADIGMVFQQFNLFPHFTVLQNLIEAPMAVRGQSRKAATERARDLLAQVGLVDKEASFPSELSGGQQQRVAIARALAMEPQVMLFDEPTSALDPELVGEVLNVMRNLAGAGMTMLVVTHEMHFAEDVANRVIVFDQGRIVEQGAAAEVLRNPQHARSQAFLKRLMRTS
jgi:polar amino acid transport system ATP-binding protein